jgi:hypothetical protein
MSLYSQMREAEDAWGKRLGDRMMWHSRVFAFGAVAVLAAIPALAAAPARAPVPRPALRPAAQPAVPPPELSGIWVREDDSLDLLPPDMGTGPLRADLKNPGAADVSNPILKPWAVAVLQREAKARAGKPVRVDEYACRPLGVPLVMAARPRMQIEQTRGRPVILRFERDTQARTINLATAHPQNLTPSRFGDSIGRYEGGALIVDTVAQSQRIDLDRFGTPHTEALRVIERFRVFDNGARLESTVTVEDPKTFTTSWSGIIRWKKGEGALAENSCEGESTQRISPVAVSAP